MDKKIEELKKRFEALEKERQTLLEQKASLEKRISDVVVEQLRTSGGIQALSELKREPETEQDAK